MAALTSPNLLGIPQIHYGTTGVNTGNLVHESIRRSTGLQTKYDANSRKIVVLNSSTLPLVALLTILMNNQYEGWRPVVEPRKHSSDNWQIRLACIMSETRPRHEPPRFSANAMPPAIIIIAWTTSETHRSPQIEREEKKEGMYNRKESAATKVANFFRKFFK